MRRFTPRNMRDTDARGFSLIEVIVVMVIISILASIAIPIYRNQQQTVRASEVKSALTSASVVLKQERTGSNGLYPSLLSSDVVIPTGASVAYTHSNSKDAYCLEMSIPGENTSMFLSGDKEGDTSISDTDCTMTAPGPSQPILSGDLSSTNQPILSWGAVDGAAKYAVYSSGAWVITINDGAITTWKGTTALDTSTKYLVKAIDSAGRYSADSNEVTLRPSKSKPTNAPSLSLINVNGTTSQRTGTITWNIVTWAEKYSVRNATTGVELWSGTDTSLDISAAIGQTVSVYVVAMNDVGASPQSNSVTLTGPLPTSPTLSGTTVQGASGVTITLTWGNVPGAVAYNLYKNGTKIASNVTSGKTDLTGWNNGNITYYVVPVTAASANGTQSNTITMSTVQPIPATPTWRWLAPYDATQVQAAWDASTYANSYNVSYSVNGAAYVTVSTTALWQMFTNIQPGDNVSAKIAAVGYSGTSAYNAVSNYARPMPTPSQYAGVAPNDYTSGLTYACTSGQVAWQYQDDGGRASGSYGAWSAWFINNSPAVVRNTHASVWGTPTHVNYVAYCRNATTGVIGGSVAWNVTLPAKTLPAPVAYNWTDGTPYWNGSSVYASTTLLVYGAAQGGCPAGTTLESKYHDRMDSSPTYGAWSAYATAPNLTQSVTYGAGIAWNATAIAGIGIRCAVGATKGPENIYDGRYLPAPMVAPVGQWVGLGGYRWAQWGSGCPGGSYPVYYFSKTGSAPAAYGWTTATSWSQTTRAWGRGTMTVQSACVSNWNGGWGPSVYAYGAFG